MFPYIVVAVTMVLLAIGVAVVQGLEDVEDKRVATYNAHMDRLVQYYLDEHINGAEFKHQLRIEQVLREEFIFPEVELDLVMDLDEYIPEQPVHVHKDKHTVRMAYVHGMTTFEYEKARNMGLI
jgi:hypothetical protein